MTYTLLNLFFFVALAIIGWLAFKGRFNQPHKKAIILTVITLFICTALFDSLIIWLDIVNYNESTLLGLYIWKAPIEDFSYALVAAIGAPILWHNLKLDKKEE